MDEDRKMRGGPVRTVDPAGRAEILAAFTAIREPTGAEAEAAAARLGVGKLQLYRLARAWRIHGRAAMGMGEARRDPAVRAAAIAAADEPLDLSQFAPERHAEIRRRVDIIGRYLREDSVARSISNRYAEEWGVAYNTFRLAMTAWMLSPTPQSLPGVSDWTTGRARNRGRIDPAAAATLDRVLTDAGPDASDPAVARRVARACHAAGVVSPSPAYVARLRAERARAANAADGTETALCLDRVLIDPRENGIGNGPPFTLGLLFGALTGRVVAHLPWAGPPDASLDALMLAEHLGGEQADNDLLLEISIPAGERWGRLDALLRSGGVEAMPGRARGLNSARLAAASLGWRLGGVRLRPVPRAFAASHDVAEGPSAGAAAALAEAVEAHNAGRASPPMGLGPAAGRGALAAALLALAGDG